VGAASRRGGEEQEEQVRRAIQHDQLEVSAKREGRGSRGGDLPKCWLRFCRGLLLAGLGERACRQMRRNKLSAQVILPGEGRCEQHLFSKNLPLPWNRGLNYFHMIGGQAHPPLPKGCHYCTEISHREVGPNTHAHLNPRPTQKN